MQSGNKQILVLMVALLGLSVSAQQTPLVQQGIAAFSEGDYPQALESFEAAEASGNESESVDYNIAVSLYRLGRYREAEQRLRLLEGLPRWRVLVAYNLGLVSEAQGNLEQAESYYRLAADQQEHEKISRLAEAKLDGLNRLDIVSANAEGSVEVRNRNWAALIDITAGIDTNASSLADNLLEDRNGAEDSFSQLLLYGHGYLSGQPGEGLRLYGLGFAKRLDELDYLDSQVVGFGTVWEQALLGWQSEIGVSLISTELDSRKVADQLQISTSIRRRFTPGTLKLGLSYSDFSAGDRFRQIDGDRYRAEATLAKRFDRLTGSLRYRHEWNNRQDLSRGGAAASYSPIRQGLRAKLDWRMNSKFDSHIEAEFIDSEYRGVNRLRDVDGSIRQTQRENRKFSLGTGLSYRFSDKLRLELEYRHDDVDDAFDLYTYDKRRLQASIQYQL